MDIFLENLEKRFNREKIFSSLSFQFTSGKSYALTGPNGSGKSTLLQVIAGNQLPSSGKVYYKEKERGIEAEDFFTHVSYAAPYLELIEEFTLIEQIEFHFKFKAIRPGKSFNDLIDISYFTNESDKVIKHFSSGMKQRLKLTLAFFSDTPVLLLDEPTSNLDEKGANWYKERVIELKDRLMIIASNQPEEYSFCNEIISLNNFK